MKQGDRVKSGLWLVVGLTAVFSVPYLFGHPDGHSESYLAHFSNRVALLLVLTTAAGLGWTTGIFGLRYSDRELVAGTRWPLYVASALVMAMVALVWGLERRTGASGEALYFLDRYAQHVLGARLYRDMEFSYGPLLFWPQVLLTRATGMAFGDAHFLLLLVEWPAGLALLWYCCRQLAGSRRDCVVLFLLLSAGWGISVVDGGMNYTPLRFMGAPALALWVYGSWRGGRSALGVALLGFLGLLFFSPEQGIAFALGTLVFFGVMVRGRSRALAGFGAGCALGLWVAWRVGVLDTLLNIGGGTLDFPLLPSSRMIVLLVAVMLAGAMGVRALKERQAARPEMYLTAVCVALLPAALGRADTGHVFINTLPLLAICFCALAQTATGFRVATLALLGYVVVSGAFHVGYFIKSEAWRARHFELTQMPEGAYRGLLAAPMGFPRGLTGPTIPVVTGRYSIYLPQLLSGREPAAKIAELGLKPKLPLVLPSDWKSRCVIGEAERRDLLKGPLHPWFIPGARAQDESTQVLCDYIAERYGESEMVAPAVGYVLLERR